MARYSTAGGPSVVPNTPTYEGSVSVPVIDQSAFTEALDKYNKTKTNQVDRLEENIQQTSKLQDEILGETFDNIGQRKKYDKLRGKYGITNQDIWGADFSNPYSRMELKRKTLKMAQDPTYQEIQREKQWSETLVNDIQKNLDSYGELAPRYMERLNEYFEQTDPNKTGGIFDVKSSNFKPIDLNEDLNTISENIEDTMRLEMDTIGGYDAMIKKIEKTQSRIGDTYRKYMRSSDGAARNTLLEKGFIEEGDDGTTIITDKGEEKIESKQAEFYKDQEELISGGGPGNVDGSKVGTEWGLNSRNSTRASYTILAGDNPTTSEAEAQALDRTLMSMNIPVSHLNKDATALEVRRLSKNRDDQASMVTAFFNLYPNQIDPRIVEQWYLNKHGVSIDVDENSISKNGVKYTTDSGESGSLSMEDIFDGSGTSAYVQAAQDLLTDGTVGKNYYYKYRGWGNNQQGGTAPPPNRGTTQGGNNQNTSPQGSGNQPSTNQGGGNNPNINSQGGGGTSNNNQANGNNQGGGGSGGNSGSQTQSQPTNNQNSGGQGGINNTGNKWGVVDKDSRRAKYTISAGKNPTPKQVNARNLDERLMSLNVGVSHLNKDDVAEAVSTIGSITDNDTTKVSLFFQKYPEQLDKEALKQWYKNRNSFARENGVEVKISSSGVQFISGETETISVEDMFSEGVREYAEAVNQVQRSKQNEVKIWDLSDSDDEPGNGDGGDLSELRGPGKGSSTSRFSNIGTDVGVNKESKRVNQGGIQGGGGDDPKEDEGLSDSRKRELRGGFGDLSEDRGAEVKKETPGGRRSKVRELFGTRSKESGRDENNTNPNTKDKNETPQGALDKAAKRFHERLEKQKEEMEKEKSNTTSKGDTSNNNESTNSTEDIDETGSTVSTTNRPVRRRNDGNNEYLDGSKSVDNPSSTQIIAGELLDTISTVESNIGDGSVSDSYNAVVRHKNPVQEVTRNTIGENIEKYGNRALGRYQIIGDTALFAGTLLGLSEEQTKNLIFNQATQDKLAMALLKHEGLDKWINGEITRDEFIHNLSTQWASLPKDDSNNSYYEGDWDNTALISYEKWSKIIDDLKNKYIKS